MCSGVLINDNRQERDLPTGKKKSKRDHQSPNSDFNNLRAETLIGGLSQLSSRDPCDYMVIDSVY